MIGTESHRADHELFVNERMHESFEGFLREQRETPRASQIEGRSNRIELGT